MESSLFFMLGFLLTGTCIKTVEMKNHVREMKARIIERREEVGRQVGAMVSGVLEHYLARCHLVLAATTQHSPMFSHAIRHLVAGVYTRVVLETGLLFLQNKTTQHEPSKDQLLKGLWGDGTPTCHALILDITSRGGHSRVRILEWSELWLRPETRVVVLGEREGVEAVLYHFALRNTIHALYLALHSHTLREPTQITGLGMESSEGGSEEVRMYRRCLYCNDGEEDIRLLSRWQLNFSVPTGLLAFHEQGENFMGHEFKIVDKRYFPYFTYEHASDEPGSVVYPRDSLITRMINTVALRLNFTFTIREPLDGQWGVRKEDGSWTGIVGELQNQLVDFTMDSTLTPQRAPVLDYARVYIDESIVILSSKPRPLPEYLSLIRPFEGGLWLMLLISVITWGVALWLLQTAWSKASGGRGLSLSSSLFYSWSVILEDPPSRPPDNMTAQVLVGWWLVFCLVVSTAYRSSLISHLVVQGKSPLINSVEDLVARESWRWGTPRMTGALLTFLKTSPNPAIQKMYKGMQANSIEDGMRLVLQGDYSFIYNKYISKTFIAARYTDDVGYTPVHISNKNYVLFTGNAWACRRGAPFRRDLDQAIQRLLEAGLITFWMDDVIATHVRNTRDRKQRETKEILEDETKLLYMEEDGQVVLGLRHLQVTFYLLLLGFVLSLVTFLSEYLLHAHY